MSYSCKSIKLIEKKFKELIVDYIHHLSNKTGIELTKLYSLFFIPKKKSKKINYASVRDSLVERLNFDFPCLNVKVNEHNLYEQLDTGFILSHEKDRIVAIGKQDITNPNNILPLSKEEIEVCKQYNLLYEIPSNLFTHTVVRASEKHNKMDKLYHKLKYGAVEESDDSEDEDEPED